MIPARKQALFNRVFVAYARSLLRGHFQAIRVEGLEHVTSTLAAGPAVMISNHTSWWDPIVLMWLANYPFLKAGPSIGYALMDARNLRKLMFFRYLGVFGVELSDAEDRARIVEYAAGLLDAPGVNVWVFPQGAERPVTEPLEFKAGAARMAHRAGVPVLPMAVRYEHGRHDKPTAYLVFGPPISTTGDDAADVQAQQQAVAAQLDRIEVEVRAAARKEGTMRVLLPGRQPLLGQLATGVLSVFTAGGRRP